MGWAVVLLPEDEGRRRAECVWRAVAQAGFPAHLFEGENQPHISLAVLQTQDGSLQAITARFAAEVTPFGVTFGAVGSFGTDVIYLEPEPKSYLLALNRALTAALGSLAALIDRYYVPGTFQPHLTVAFKVPEEGFSGALRAVNGSFVPFHARFNRLAVVKFHPAKVVETHYLGKLTE
jgi:2'-5' RNA ligase